MKSILLHVSNDEDFESRLQVALDLARDFEGHLTCLQPVTYDVIVGGDYYGALAAVTVNDLREDAARYREQIEQRLEREDVAWDWISDLGSAEARLVDRASLHDIAVLGAKGPADREGQASTLVGDISLYARTPVLVVPHDCNRIDVDGPAVVAWNGTAEAANALRAALPILSRSSSVHLITVASDRPDQDERTSATEAAQYLSRHGVKSELLEIPAAQKEIAQTIIQAAQTRNAACIVMGAYGHSRLRETVFGGVTRDMLRNVEVPLLLAH